MKEFPQIRPYRPGEASITKPFSCAGTEPQLAELLADPLTQLVMRRDRITEHEVHAAVEIARRALRADTRRCRPRASRLPSDEDPDEGRLFRPGYSVFPAIRRTFSKQGLAVTREA
jgi:hypothetical protein